MPAGGAPPAPLGDDGGGDGAKLLFDVKLALVFLVGVFTLLASLLPWWIAARLGSRRSLDAINCAGALSAGVVVGALLTHMLPESAESFEAFMQEKYPDPAEGSTVARLAGFPFPGLLCGVVFLLLVAVDVLIVRRGADGHGHSHGAEAGGHDHISEALHLLKARAQALELQPLQHTALDVDAGGDETGRAAPSPGPGFQSQPHHAGGGGGVGGGSGYGSMGGGGGGARRGGKGGDVSEHAHAHSHGGGSHHHHEDEDEEREAAAAAASARQRLVRAYVFFGALSLHGVFDGLSVGSEDSAASFTSTAGAVLSHKMFDGLALGCALHPLGLPTVHRWVLLVACALTTPAGIGAGLAATQVADSLTLKLVNGIFLGAASGSFLFISLTEMWPSSISDGRLVPGKLALFATGFVAMAALAAYV